ncbi:MAG: PDZ domain-containing protein [Verrucomicrobiales bacterium]
MKIPTLPCYLAATGIISLSGAIADNAKPDQASGEGTLQGAAWLGVATAPVDEVVAAQLDLPEGIGAAVKLVIPDSPAEAAGISKHDILFELEGEPVKSPEHLGELIRGKSNGDSVELAVIQRGEKKSLTLTLGTRPPHLQQEPEAHAKPFGGRIDLGDLGGLKFEMLPFRGNGAGFGNIEKQMEKMRKQMEMHLEGMFELEEFGNLLPGAARMMGSSSMMLSNDEGSIEIRSKDGKTDLTAKDPDGKIIFEGPVNTDEERAKLPERLRNKLEEFKKSSNGLSLKGFRLGMPQLKIPDLKPPGKDAPVPAAEKDGKKIRL